MSYYLHSASESQTYHGISKSISIQHGDFFFLFELPFQSMAMIRKPTDTYMRKMGYRARAFLLGLTAVLINGYAAQELQAKVRLTTMILSMTLSLNRQIKAPMSRGKRQ